MKKTIVRITLLALAALLVLSLVACGDADTYAQFTVSEDETVLSDGTDTYTRHTLPRGFYRGAYLGEEPVYNYYNSVRLDDRYAQLRGRNGILLTDLSSLSDVYFATDAAEAELQTFYAGDYQKFALGHGNGPTGRYEKILVPAAQKNTILSGYAASTVTRGVDVTTIDQNNWFPLVAKDKTGTFSTQIGALLMLDNACYYVDLTALDNSHFDADGFFSFRSGTVTFKQLTGDAAAVANALLTRYADPNDDDRSPTLQEGMTAESLAKAAEAAEKASVALFWGLYVVAGFVLPGAGLTVSLIFATRPKPHARRWFTAVGMAGAWLLISCIVLLLLLL